MSRRSKPRLGDRGPKDVKTELEECCGRAGFHDQSCPNNRRWRTHA